MSETGSDSTPEPTSSRIASATCSRSTGTSVSPRASIRSTASRVSASEAGGAGLIMMIQTARGAGGLGRGGGGLDHDDPAGQGARGLRAREVEDLAEALRRDEPDARALALEHGVRRDGR